MSEEKVIAFRRSRASGFQTVADGTVPPAEVYDSYLPELWDLGVMVWTKDSYHRYLWEQRRRLWAKLSTTIKWS